jgi:hypothetical protein
MMAAVETPAQAQGLPPSSSVPPAPPPMMPGPLCFSGTSTLKAVAVGAGGGGADGVMMDASLRNSNGELLSSSLLSQLRQASVKNAAAHLQEGHSPATSPRIVPDGR